MITGYETFCLYQSLRLHFNSDSYDFHKYGGKSRTSVDAFENRKDKYFFYKLSRKFQSKNDLIDFIVANFVNNESVWIGNLLDEESINVYRERQRVLQSLSYVFENDCTKIFEGVSDPNEVLKVKDNEHPVLLTMSLQKVIETETFCILNKILNFVPSWNKKISDTIIWPQYRQKIIKYTTFLSFNDVKYKSLLKKVLDENRYCVS